MTEEIEMIEKLKALHEEFYNQFDRLQKAMPVLSDDAYESVANHLLEQYELHYKLLDSEYRTGIEREIARLEARYDRLVPFRWRTRWLRKYKQNYAATLVDKEADEHAKAFFADCEAEIAAQYLTGDPPCDPNATSREGSEEFEIVGGIEEPSEGELEKNGVKESAEGVKNASESDSETEVEEDSPSKRRRRKLRKEKEKNVCTGNQA